MDVQFRVDGAWLDGFFFRGRHLTTPSLRRGTWPTVGNVFLLWMSMSWTHHVVVSSSSHRVALVRSNPTLPARARMRFTSRRHEVRGLRRQSRMDRLLASFQACLFRSHRPRFTTRPTGRGVVCTRLCMCNRRWQKQRQESPALAKARQKDVLLARGAGTLDSGWCAATPDVALGRALAGVVVRVARRVEAGVL